MKRYNLTLLIVLICLLSAFLLEVEAKSQEKSKEKYTQKHHKTEGKSKEVKQKYSKNYKEAEKNSKKYKKYQVEGLEIQNPDEEPQEVEYIKSQELSQKPSKQKERKPYTVSVELVEEAISQRKVKQNRRNVNSESENYVDSGICDGLKQKVDKKQVYQGGKNVETSQTNSEDDADFIVHIPKNNKATRQVLVFQLPAEKNEENKEELENAVQEYVSENVDAKEVDCRCEENPQEEHIRDKKTPEMCYY